MLHVDWALIRRKVAADAVARGYLAESRPSPQGNGSVEVFGAHLFSSLAWMLNKNNHFNNYAKLLASCYTNASQAAYVHAHE